MSYVEFNNTRGSSEDYDAICRICLESDHVQNLIYPCRCSGNSKYVHRECLNEWRIINRDNDKYHKCEICDYTFKVSTNTIILDNGCIKFLHKLTDNSCSYLLILSMVSYISAFGLKLIDKNRVIIDFFFSNAYDNNATIFKYYLFFVSIFMILHIFYVLFSLFYVKNIKLYINLQKEYLSRHLLPTIIIGITIYLLLDALILGIYLEISILYLCRVHVNCIKLIDRENNIANIENYIEENEV